MELKKASRLAFQKVTCHWCPMGPLKVYACEFPDEGAEICEWTGLGEHWPKLLGLVLSPVIHLLS